MIRAELWARGTATLGEAPRLLRDGTLRWTDLLEGIVFARDAEGAAHPVDTYAGETVSALLPLADGRIALALRRRIVVLDAERIVGTVGSELPPGFRYSDGIAGPSGHLWIGVVADEGQAAPGWLVRVGAAGSERVRDGIGFANGIGFSVDGTKLFHVDSADGSLTVFAHDPRTGALGDSVLLYRHDGPGELDGLAVDERDRLWVAVFGGARVLCIETAGDRAGTVVDHVQLAARRVTSCCFGLADDLYITTARVDATPGELADEPLAGSVFHAFVGCTGAPRHEGRLPA